MDRDYIVIGSGSAGAVLANRLTHSGIHNVLLLEAGGSDRDLRYKVPALCVACIGNPASDWMFMSEPDATRADRTDMLSRGKVLGGSSSINGIIYVRGNRGDYDGWAQMGNRGWDYDTMLGYFRRLEGNRDGSSETYGKSGPVAVGELRGAPHLSHVFVEAMDEIGIRKNPSYNGEPSEGASIAHATQHMGWRWSTARGYLRPAMKRPNLTVRTGATVRRILMEGRRAVGVEYDYKGQVHSDRAGREILLSASTFNSPKLLMLSGIGPAEQLRKHGIEVLHDLPGVGRNLQDHAAVHVKALVNRRTTNMDENLLGRFRHGLRFATTMSGPAGYLQSAVAFARSRPELEYPDIQFHFGAFAFDVTAEGIRMLDRPAVTLQPNVNNTRSRGHMELRSADPAEPPRIHANMLSDPQDVATLVAGIGIARRALATRAFAPFLIGELKPGAAVTGVDDLVEYIRATSNHVYHACGTCKMGVDPMAVVDPELRVHGVTGLRVIDSSIIPQIPSGNLNAISMAIGEKGADMVLADALGGGRS